MTARTIIIRLTLTAMLAAAPAAAGDDGDWIWPSTPPLHVFSFRGYWAPVLQLDRAWARLGGVDETSRWSAPQVPARFPVTREDINRYHLIVVVDMDVSSWPAGTLELCREYVRQGGAMIFFGGRHAFSAGYAGSPLEDLAPVTFQAADSLEHAPAGMLLKPGPQADGLTGNTLDWSARPRAYWFHPVEPKPGALVIAQADNHAMLVAGQYGKGRVAVFAGTVMGNPPSGQTPFWAWRDWPALMALTVRWLTEPALERAAPDAPPRPAATVKAMPAQTADSPGDDDGIEDMLTRIEQTPSLHSIPPGMNLNASLLPPPDTVRRQTANRHQSRLDDIARAGDDANPDSIPLLRQVITEHRRDRHRDPHEGRGRTEADTLHDEALLAAVLCGDESAVRPLVDLLLQLDYTVVGMFGRGWSERDLQKRAELHDAAQWIRAWSWQAAERLRKAPASVLPALAARIAEETDPWIVPLAHRLFGNAFRGEPLSATAAAALRKSPIPAIHELVVEGIKQ